MKFIVLFALVILILAISSCISTDQTVNPGADILRAKGISINNSLFFKNARMAMVEEQLKARGIADSHVLEAMSKIKREEFIPAEYQLFAYDDRPLPITEGRSIPQPYVIAVMIEALNLEGDERVLAIEDASGYQTAVLAELSGEVFSIEPRPVLAEKMEKRVTELGYENAHIIRGAGRLGLPEDAPFDAIIIFAALEEVPSVLFDQLKDGGRLAAPIGKQLDEQTLTVFVKQSGQIFKTELGGVRFRLLETYPPNGL